MTSININGCCIRVSIPANEATGRVAITLPDGYSYETIRVLYASNITEIERFFFVTANTSYHIPPVNSRSPATLSLHVKDASKEGEIRLLIEKFGQIPDTHYFDKDFKPILVTGDDGKEYNVIPSDQFK